MNKPSWLKGVFPALVTPFDKNENINDEELRKLVRFLYPHVDGFVVSGTTGEFVYLTIEERKKLIDIVIDEVKGKKPVIAGTGCSSTKDTVMLTQYAKDSGATASLVVSPYYFNPTFKEVYTHFERLNELEFPIILYNIPQCSGVHFKWWTTEGLAELDNIVGIKDSSGDMAYFNALFEKVEGKISIICGHDEIGMSALATGADGLILASANLIPDIWQKIYMAVQDNRIDEARKLQRKIQKLVRIVVRTAGSQAVKEGLAIMGINAGYSRKPIMPGDAFQREDFEELRIQLEILGKVKKRRIGYQIGDEVIYTDIPAMPTTPNMIQDFTMLVGEGYAGPPIFEIAHIDLLLGLKHGPVGEAIDNAIEQLRNDNVRAKRMRVIREKPLTLLVSTMTIRTRKQEDIFYTYLQDGVNKAIDASIEDGFLPAHIIDKLCMIVNAFVHPSAVNKKRVMFNNYKAMRSAIRKSIEGRPTVDEMLYESVSARHPFRYTP